MVIFPHSVGKSVSGMDGEAAAQRLRGSVGTTVKVKLLDVFPYLDLHFFNYSYFSLILFSGYKAYFKY
jgi:hypothetical protein